MQYVFWTSIDKMVDDAKLEQMYILLDEQRRAKVLRCRCKEDKVRSVAAGLLLEHACKRLGIAKEQVFLLPEPMKPCEGKEVWSANVSHAGSLVAVLLSEKAAGVDVEPINRMNNRNEKQIHLLGKKILTSEELMFFSKTMEDDNCVASWMTKTWTRKEAFVKAKGIGIAMDMTQINTLEQEHFHTEIIGDKEKYFLSVYPKTDAIRIEQVEVF